MRSLPRSVRSKFSLLNITKSLMLEITLYNSQMKWAIKKLLIKRHAANQQAKQQNRNDNNRHAETNANGSKAQQKKQELNRSGKNTTPTTISNGTFNLRRLNRYLLNSFFFPPATRQLCFSVYFFIFSFLNIIFSIHLLFFF